VRSTPTLHWGTAVTTNQNRSSVRKACRRAGRHQVAAGYLLSIACSVAGSLDERRLLDKRDNFHSAAALGAFQRIDFKNALDECRPGDTQLSAIGGIRFINAGRLLCLGPLLRPETALLVRVPAVIPDLMFPFVWYMLRDFGQKIERIENLEIVTSVPQCIEYQPFGLKILCPLHCPRYSRHQRRVA
jgi:hypothetical protein